MRLVFVLTALALLVTADASARTVSEDSPLARWSYTVVGGVLIPAGDEGDELARGPHLVGALDYETLTGFQLGLDFGYTQSQDALRTRIFMVGGHGRMNPNRDLESIYVQGGLALYLVTYDPRKPGVAEPPTRLRPGISFAVGLDFKKVSRVTIGVLASYHGIVIARSDALSYVAVGLSFSLKPDDY